MLDKLTTERRNEQTTNLDTMTAFEICSAMNNEDKKVPEAIKLALPQIAKAVETIVMQLKKGGRLVYAGAGTSGRMGLMDAVECVPTFGVSDDVVIGLIAGGEKAFIKAVEGAEDSYSLAVSDLEGINFNSNDVLVGIAASGRTPYVISALDYANKIGAKSVSLSSNLNAIISEHAQIVIEVDAGSEVLTGSTRLKAGTVQKLVCNMLSTASMVLCGKAYKNLMVDVLMTNKKLEERGRRIIMEATGVDYEKADDVLSKAHSKVKTAIVMILCDCDYDNAETRLTKADGFVRKAIEN